MKPPYRARVGVNDTVGAEKGYWHTNGGSGEWLQVNLLLPHYVTEIEMAGNPIASESVTKFSVEYSSDGSTWTQYTLTGTGGASVTVCCNDGTYMYT